jgi:hypothetical protein
MADSTALSIAALMSPEVSGVAAAAGVATADSIKGRTGVC